MAVEKWVAGDEYDDVLKDTVLTALRSLGYTQLDKWSGIGGSQEISHLKVVGPLGELVVVESETYVGLSLTGPAEALATIRKAMSAAAHGR